MELSPFFYHKLIRPKWINQIYIQNKIEKHLNLYEKDVLDFGAVLEQIVLFLTAPTAKAVGFPPQSSYLLLLLLLLISHKHTVFFIK